MATHDLLDVSGLDPAEERPDAQVRWFHAVDRRQRAAEEVVDASVLVRALERDDVDGLLQDAESTGRGSGRSAPQSSSSVRLPRSRRKRTRAFTSSRP